MAAVTSYRVLLYGSPDGYLTNRAQISVFSNPGTVAGYIRFNDPGMTFEQDSESNGVIYMHLPSTMFQSVLDILRNEKPLQIYFAQGRGFFGNGADEPVGEGE